jgi:hypothetical protein
MNPSPESIGVLVFGLTALIGLAVLVKKFSGSPESRSVSPQPLIVKEAIEYATTTELNALRIELIQRIVDHERRNESDMVIIREDLKELRRGNEYVQRRVNGMSTTVYKIAGKLGIVNVGGEPLGDG